jgi:hypothetical protein
MNIQPDENRKTEVGEMSSPDSPLLRSMSPTTMRDLPDNIRLCVDEKTPHAGAGSLEKLALLRDIRKEVSKSS